MPNFDGTGPKGQGAMTGRKKGRCNNTNTTQTEKSTDQSVENKGVANGLGRGGKPRGGGGLGKGSCDGKGQGRGHGKGFGGKQ